jgi:hypothetical protein
MLLDSQLQLCLRARLSVLLSDRQSCFLQTIASKLLAYQQTTAPCSWCPQAKAKQPGLVSGPQKHRRKSQPRAAIAKLCLTVWTCLYSYPLHKWMHANKTAFRLMHKKHHGRQGRISQPGTHMLHVRAHRLKECQHTCQHACQIQQVYSSTTSAACLAHTRSAQLCMPIED